jgi:hypothetical protein
LQACVKNSSDLGGLNKLFGDFAGEFGLTTGQMIAEVEGNAAKVAVECNFQMDGKAQSVVEFVALEKTENQWQIAVPANALAELTSDESSTTAAPRPLRMITAIIGTPDGVKVFERARERAQAVASLSNVKQINTGVLMYTQDYDEILPTPASKYTELVQPYVRNNALFHAPAAPVEEMVSYSFNKNLQGVSLAAIAAPATTIMIYEGKDGKPNYRYEGMTVIGFVDGHAKMCTPQMVAGYLWSDPSWKPQRTTAKPAPVKKTTKPVKKGKKR